MADLKEFQSFVSKFLNLGKEGKDAKFQVCSNAGKAMTNSQLELRDVLLPPVNHHVPALPVSVTVRGDRKHGVNLQLKKLFKELRKSKKLQRKEKKYVDNPLYFSAKQEVKFELTSWTARKLIYFANPHKIFFWMGISCKLINFQKTR